MRPYNVLGNVDQGRRSAISAVKISNFSKTKQGIDILPLSLYKRCSAILHE